MQRIACTLVFLLLGTPSAYGQVAIDASTSTGRGVNATTVRLTGTLLTPIPCCAAGGLIEATSDPFVFNRLLDRRSILVGLPW